MRVGVLASGAGTNLQAILDRVHGSHGVEVVAVGSDQPGAPALERAAARRRGDRRVPARGDADRAGARRRDRRLARRARASSSSCSPATWRCSTPAFLARFPQRVINVHPALLPAFPGVRAIEQALAYGVKVFGVTVHFVDEGVDTGPVIAQRALELPDAADPAEVREALRPLEHDLLCEAVELIARGAVSVRSRATAAGGDQAVSSRPQVSSPPACEGGR